MDATGRLAPTPSGNLHLGNIVAFGAAWLSARAAGGRVLLRMEDVDTTRSRPHFAGAIREDLAWLGLDWDEETPRQADRDYTPWIHRLGSQVYHCVCSRSAVRRAGGIYPGTCRDAGHPEGAVRFRLPDVPVVVHDRRFGIRTVAAGRFGDPVLRRRDQVFAYNLAVVADDLVDGVTEVVRGADLLDFTSVQILLWRALRATPPTWLHAPMLLGPDGRKLSKSHDATEILRLRGDGWTATDVWRTVLPCLGLAGIPHVHEAVGAFRPDVGPRGPIAIEDPPERPTSRGSTLPT